MEFVIITGMSGAGKTTALHVLEDIGYYCVDNIPASLLSTLYTLCSKSEDSMMKKVAVVVDVRGNENFEDMYTQIENFKKSHEDVSILFFDAKVDCLIIRYKETRRKHPLAERLKDGSVAEAVTFEKALLTSIKKIADYKIDTTYLSNKQLRERVMSMFMEDTSQSLTLTFMSFGFKYGIPLEADLIIDVRCLPNPYYIPELKPLTGLDQVVRDYVLKSEDTQEFLKRTLNLLDFSVPLYLKEGKSELVVGIGCTGGKHRSVTIARQLDEHFVEKGYKCVIQHRDVKK
ncbi:MAG: RNase adapter RapZ [Ruminococcus sp.]|nr:RNase adapter RapZ [Ruminococcus sp.]